MSQHGKLLSSVRFETPMTCWTQLATAAEQFLVVWSMLSRRQHKAVLFCTAKHGAADGFHLLKKIVESNLSGCSGCALEAMVRCCCCIAVMRCCDEIA